MEFEGKSALQVTGDRSATERYLGTDEAAAILMVHPKTLQRMARKGEVRGVRVGRMWRFRGSDPLFKSN